MTNSIHHLGRQEVVQEQSRMAIIKDKIRFSFLSRVLAVAACAGGMLLVMCMVRKNRRAA
ncbi:MAG: hypothetical protein GXY32_01845 [Ruminococcaceae bacterium]|nr:hypothetical protein [Oscillospiraceae bacterium]